MEGEKGGVAGTTIPNAGDLGGSPGDRLSINDERSETVW